MKLKSITDNFWIILSATNEKIGTLSEDNGQYNVIVNGDTAKVGSKDELIAALGVDLFQDVVKAEKETESVSYINGYPAFIAGAVPKKLEEPELVNIPAFTKHKESNVVFAAGYYCIKFPKQTMPASSPKIQTLTKYGFLGPFKTQQEMNFHLQKARAAK